MGISIRTYCPKLLLNKTSFLFNIKGFQHFSTNKFLLITELHMEYRSPQSTIWKTNFSK